MSGPISRRVASLVALLAGLALAVPASAQFTYAPPGELVAGSGMGRRDDMVYVPDMLFPIRDAPAFANSQVWGVGGSMGPSGGQCDARNFGYPWHDNYCESRSWDMPLCPAGTGHQGQDIRASDCRAEMHPAIAVANGTITNVGSYSVYLTAADGTRFDYLHMRPVTVREGQTVRAGDVVGYVANEFGGTPTTVHLHFNIRRNVAGVGVVYAPTYMSLVRAYERLTGVASGPRFRAEYVEQTFPLASEPFELAPGQEQAGYLELRNTGTETWRPGRTFLGTTEPRDGESALAGPDWISPTRAATVDREVAPGDTGRFAFTVRAPAVPGDYPQYFNVVEEGVAWFGDDGGPPDRWIQVRVTVVAAPERDAGTGAGDAGGRDSGSAEPDAGTAEDAGAAGISPRGAPISGGCGCRAAGGGPVTGRSLFLGLLVGVALVALGRRAARA
jgi:hypothetical protein